MEIRVLPSDVVDQIAAGEVVERPSHLLKELLENCIDAQATKIEIDIDEGGKKLKVSDDGKGIHKEDLPLVCARHATSKISQADELWRLHTFGFRGEALASISSVSRLKITSKYKTEKSAYSLQNEFGLSQDILPAGRDVGTTVEIEDLFTNVPARLKFLKSDSAEISQMKNVIRALALAYPEVEFKLKQQGKVTLYYNRESSFVERAKKVLELKEVFTSQNEYQGMKLEAVFSSPQTTTGNSRQIWIFVQNRWVTDRTIQAAIMESYRSLLMHGEYPYVALKLTVPDGFVDVNIHPTKSQIKFVDNSQIFKFVHASLRKELEQAPWIQNLDKPEEPVERNLSFSAPTFQQTQYQKKDFSITALHEAADRRTEELFVQTDLPKEETAHVSLGFWSQLQVLGQSHLTYILAEGNNSFFMIDQHAAHERVVFEQLMESWKQRKFDIQDFLIPLSIDLPPESVDQLIALSDDFTKLGIGIEKAGPESLLVVSCPSFISESGLVKSLTQFADDIVNLGGSFSFEKKVADIFATMACHSVVRAGQAMSMEEMKSLLKQMDEFRLSSYCPHGRNVYLEIPFSKIEKDFGRIL